MCKIRIYIKRRNINYLISEVVQRMLRLYSILLQEGNEVESVKLLRATV